MSDTDFSIHPIRRHRAFEVNVDASLSENNDAQPPKKHRNTDDFADLLLTMAPMLAQRFSDLSKQLTQFFDDLSKDLAQSASQDPPRHHGSSRGHDHAPSYRTPPAAPTAPAPSAAPASDPAPSPTHSPPPVARQPAGTDIDSRSVRDAEKNTHPQFKPVLRGDEKARDSAINNQADFGRAVDDVARDYGLDPNMFRAELNAESSAFSGGDFRRSMKAEGDLDRAGDNNTSIGLGQISRKFLDGREWSDGGPGNPRVGSQVVTTQEYENSVTVQLRMAASNIAQRIEDKGGVVPGLMAYVGSTESEPKGASYLSNIEKFMNDASIMDIGRD